MADYKEVVFGIELDALFDTRMATLSRMGIENVEQAIVSGYYQREFDVFEGIDMDVYSDLYRQRDHNTLKEAMITPMVEFVNIFVRQTIQAFISSPFIRKPVIEIQSSIHMF